MTISDRIDQFIAEEGQGNVRDALNIALTRLDLHDIELATKTDRVEALESALRWIGTHAEIAEMIRDLLMNNPAIADELSADASISLVDLTLSPN